jgi:hypothetical protein
MKKGVQLSDAASVIPEVRSYFNKEHELGANIYDASFAILKAELTACLSWCDYFVIHRQQTD